MVQQRETDRKIAKLTKTLISERRQVLIAGAVWNPTAIPPAPAGITPEDVQGSFTPEFGAATPDFGTEVLKSFGEAEVLMRPTETWPRYQSV